MARWGLVIVAIYAVVALLTPLLVSLGVLPDVNTGLSNPIYDPPTWSHWCGTDRLGRDVCVRTMAGSGVALQVVLLLYPAQEKILFLNQLNCVLDLRWSKY